MVVSPEANICAIAVTGFDGLMFAYGEGNRTSNPRTRLFRRQVLYAAQAGNAPIPEVPVDRQPQALLNVVTQMPLQRAYRGFTLRFGYRTSEK